MCELVISPCLSEVKMKGSDVLKVLTYKIVIVAVIFTILSKEKADRIKLYVATNGNDAWSGKSRTPNAANTDGPFATLERARDEIRKLKKKSSLPSDGCAYVAVLLENLIRHGEQVRSVPHDTG